MVKMMMDPKSVLPSAYSWKRTIPASQAKTISDPPIMIPRPGGALFNLPSPRKE
jgi:hypothetical protein